MSQEVRTRRKWLALLVWGGVAGISFGLGYRSVLSPRTASRITLGNRPQGEPDESLTVDLWAEQPAFIENKDTFALVTERSEQELSSVRFLCPRSPNLPSELLLRFPLSEQQPVQAAFLQLTLLASAAYDPLAQLRLWVASPATGNEWLELVELSVATGEDQIPEAFDITPYVQGAAELRLRMTCLASRLIYHPTPDDPIGYASCQALRQPRYEAFAAKLEIWHAPRERGEIRSRFRP